ncbi:MAG TPA: polysaccharide deacetylase family protein [Acidobacteriaceae bacterium]
MKIGWGQLFRTGFWSLILGGTMGLAIPVTAQQIAITFDDLPAHGPLPKGETRMDVAKRVIRALHNAQVPPTYGFVNGIRVQEQADTIGVLGAWVAAGNPLGNHTWSHMNLNQNSLGAFEQDIAHNEQLIQLQMKDGDWHWFRFPFLAEGDTPEKQMGVRAWLAQHGYKIAGVTMSFADYEWNEPYARCSEKKDVKEIAWLETSYLRAADESIRFDRGLSKQLYGHDIPYVLLMHIGAFDARMLPRLLDLYKRRGFSFVTLEQAELDPFYKYDADPKLLLGPDSLEGAAAAKHMSLPGEQDFSKRLDAVCR